MDYTKNDYRTSRFLLERIGYIDIQKIDGILEYYGKRYGLVLKRSSEKGIKNRKGKVYKYLNTYREELDATKCIEVLKYEIDFKSNLIEEKKIDFTKYITASDLNSFTFCKASFSISNSFFTTDSLNSFNREIGNKLHEDLRIVAKRSFFDFKDGDSSFFSNFQKEFLNKIKSCELIFTGHNQEKNLFYNHKINFVGQPDYIFKDPKGKFFIIEEKYHFRDNDERLSDISLSRNENFFLNSIIQLQSYIEFITDFDIQYGILINWYYSIINDKVVVNDFTFKILSKGGNHSELLFTTFKELSKLLQGGMTKFDNNTSINKCLKCSVNLYCGHKTDTLTSISFPYDKANLKLKFINYQR